MKQITIFIAGFAAFASIQASAEDFTAGKSPAQLFRSDCGECHRSPNGLARDPVDVRALTSFLREHYTTKSETAGALAAYVSGFASTARNRGPGAGAPSARDRNRYRSDAETEEAPATQRAAEEAPAASQPGQAPARHRRATSMSADGERKRMRDDGDVLRPPRGIGTAAAKPNGQTRASQPQPHEADDPISRLRTYFSSGTNAESAAADRAGAPKARKRRNAPDDAKSANTEAPAVEPAAAAPAATPRQVETPAETAPDEPK